MSSEAIKCLFRPKGIAVWVPSFEGEEIPLLARNLMAEGYRGRVVLMGQGPPPPSPLERCPDPEQLGPGLELLLFTGDLAQLARALPRLGRSGVKAAVIYSPPPADESGRDALLASARKAGIRLAGPGSWGVVNTAVGLAAVPERLDFTPGGLALITQSRVVCCYFLAEAAKKGLGLGTALDLGAEADLTQDEVLDYLAHHYQAKAVALHLGRVKRPASFISAALAAARQKPVLALKAWETSGPCQEFESGRFPLPTQEEAWDAVLRRAGVPRLESLDSLLAAGDLAARLGSCPGPRVLVLSESTGAGSLARDALVRHGLSSAEPDDAARRALVDLGCRLPGRDGPVLLPFSPNEKLYRAVTGICLRSEGVDALLVAPAPDPERDIGSLAEAVGRTVARCRAGESRMPVMFVRTAGDGMVQEGPIPGGVLFFEGPEKMAEAYAGLWRYCRAVRLAQEIPRKPLGRFQLDRDAASRLLDPAQRPNGPQMVERLKLLNAYRLPVVPTRAADSPAELERICESWGYPSRLILVPEIPPEAPLPRELSWIVRSKSLAASQWRAAHQHASRHGRAVRAILAQPRFSPAGPLLMMGWHRHPELGPLMVFGQGGHASTAPGERTWCPAPLNHAQARAMLARTRVFAEATRSENPDRVWPSLLEEVLIKLARMAQDLPEIQSLALNPVLIHDRMAWIPDAEMELLPPAKPERNGLVMSPYPERQEARVRCAGGTEVLLRPVRPEDAGLVRELFSRLSPESVHSRFFRDIPALTSRMLVALTQIDYDREIALAAVLAHGLEEKILGLCSLAARPGSEWSEFSVVVRDSWQRKGIGRLLMTRMAEIARSRGRLKIVGLVQRRNRAMLQLGRELGFSIGPPSEDLVELRWELAPTRGPLE